MIEQLIYPREIVLTGDLRVHRILPFRTRRMVGPFAYLDEMGPFAVQEGTTGDILPHPHIGLSTLTWLFEGALVHRDSLGSLETVRPGAVNWMTAGSGIVHSERIPPELRANRGPLHGLQAWVALPLEAEEGEPAFEHRVESEVPAFEVDSNRLRLVAGQAFGRQSPLRTHSRLFYVDAHVPSGSKLRFDPEGQEAAFFLRQGSLVVEGTTIESPVLLVFQTGRAISLQAKRDTHGVLLGGDSVGKRWIWWNFVSSSQERIEKAKARWRNQEFPAVPGEHEFIPLPETNLQRERSTMP